MSDYEVILGHYGEESQMLKAIEEMGELTSVLIRWLRDDDRAEELVGHPELITDFDIWLQFPQGLDDVPKIEVSTSVVSRKAFDVMRSKEG